MSDKTDAPEQATPPQPELAPVQRSAQQIKSEKTETTNYNETRKEERNLTREEEFSLESMNDGVLVSMRVEGDAEARAGLFKKIVKVQKEMKVLAHTGSYSAGQTSYTYATERDVIEPISDAFSRAGIAIMHGIVGGWFHDMPGRYAPNRVTTVQTEHLFGDSETGAYLVTGSRSTAANADKATNAAFTTAVKYLLAKSAGVAFGDDADEYTLDGTKAGTQGPKPKPLTKDERAVLTKEIQTSGKGEDIKVWMKAGAVTFSKITDAQAAAMREKFELA